MAARLENPFRSRPRKESTSLALCFSTLIGVGVLAGIEFDDPRRAAEAAQAAAKAQSVSQAHVERSARPETAPEGFALVATLPKAEFEAGEKVVVSTRFENRMSQPCTLVHPDFFLCHRVIVRDEAGDEAPLSEEGQARRDSFENCVGWDREARQTIGPGESGSDRLTELGRLYRLAPGRYRVEVVFDADSLHVVSNAVPFLVKDRGAKAPGPDHGGVELVASLPKAVFRDGEPILLATRFENRSDRACTVWHSGYFPNHWVIVRSDTGQEADLTEEGRSLRAAFAPERGRDKNFPVTIEPGGADEDGSIDLRRFYRLGPGRYRAEVTYHDGQGPTPMKMTSNRVDFEVK